MSRIPFNRPSLTGKELEYIAEAIAAGHASGDGEFTKKCQGLLAETLGVPKVLLTTSCTHGLELAALLLDIGPGAEVIVPSFTFPSTANAFALRGARPVFADIRPDTLNLDEQALEALITPRTKLIVPVHYAGVGCEMDKIRDIARARRLRVVEDNAHGLFGRYMGNFLGTLGDLGVQSFHETKNFTCGEGGALLINDPELIDRAEILREKGTDRSRFFRGEVDKYSWVDVGSSYLPSDILAAFLYAQLEARASVQEMRQRVWRFYQDHLQGWAAASGVQLPCVPAHCEQSYHMFYMILPSLAERDRLIGRLREQNILSVFHYLPLHASEMGRRFGAKEGDCPVAERVSDRLIRLPFYNDLTEADQIRIIDAIVQDG